MNSLGKARFLLEPPKGSSDRFEGGRKELVILEEGAPFGLSQRLLLLQSPPQVTVVDSKNHPPYKHTYTNNKPLTCFSWSSTAWGHFGMTAQQEAGLEVLKRHIPGRKRERSQIASCFPLAFSSPPPYGIRCLPDPSCSEEPPPTSSPVMSMHQRCVTSPYVQDWGWLIFFSRLQRSLTTLSNVI